MPEPCSGCEKRAATLNQLSRRGFFGGAAFLLSASKNAILVGLWQVAGAALPIGVPEALGFIRTFLTEEVIFYSKNNRHGSQNEMLQEIIKHKEHFKPGTTGYAWMSRFNPFSDEVLPGWTIDFAVVHRGYPRWLNEQDEVNDGFRLVLKNERYCLVVDETIAIYQVKTPDVVPSATSLESAESLPGAVPANMFRDDELSWLDRVKRFLIPTVQAQSSCPCTCSKSACVSCCGCLLCVCFCCSSTVACGVQRPSHSCFAAVGCVPGCNFIFTACNAGSCTTCAQTYWGTCCGAMYCIDPMC
jgi:hypothetical protein